MLRSNLHIYSTIPNLFICSVSRGCGPAFVISRSGPEERTGPTLLSPQQSHPLACGQYWYQASTICIPIFCTNKCLNHREKHNKFPFFSIIHCKCSDEVMSCVSTSPWYFELKMNDENLKMLSSNHLQFAELPSDGSVRAQSLRYCLWRLKLYNFRHSSLWIRNLEQSRRSDTILNFIGLNSDNPAAVVASVDTCQARLSRPRKNCRGRYRNSETWICNLVLKMSNRIRGNETRKILSFCSSQRESRNKWKLAYTFK